MRVMQPLTVELKIRIRIWREKRLWIADCPALGITTQGTSERNAKRAFEEAMEAAFEIHRERNTMSEILRHAAAHPETLWESVDHPTKMTELGIAMPLSDFLSARDKAQQVSA